MTAKSKNSSDNMLDLITSRKEVQIKKIYICIDSKINLLISFTLTFVEFSFFSLLHSVKYDS